VIAFDDLVAANPGGYLLGPPPPARLARFCFDSRLVLPGDLFVAVRTPHGDGHDFVADALARGAHAVLVDRAPAGRPAAVPTLVVDDTVDAMARYGAHVVRTWRPRVVAVTGSVGKTATKELVAEVLSRKFSVFRTPGNYSGRYGLAVALGGLRPEHELAVVEMATGHFGEVADMCAMAPPEVAIVTAVGQAHLLSFEDLEGVAREKSTLVKALPSDGLAVLNADDPRVLAMGALTCAETATVSSAGGTGVGADYTADHIRVARDGTRFAAHSGRWAGDVHLPWLGAHHAVPVLAALAVARHFGVDLDEVVDTARQVQPIPGRLRPLPGVEGSLLLDDTYNAAPTSVLAGLDTLAALPAGRRIAVLGDMAELGKESEDLHRMVGRRASQVVDHLVTRGQGAACIADEARRQGMSTERIAVTFTHEDAASAVRSRLGGDTVVLVKGSAPSRMELVVERLLAPGTTPSDVLVRQDAAWRSITVVQPDRPTWLEVDLSAIGHNVRHLASRAPQAELMVVLKADAYGHGAVPVGHTALRNGATRFGVACVPEGRVLREAGIEAPVLVLGYTPGWQAREAVALGLALSVFDLGTARTYSEAARALDRTVALHVKVDTGMHRLGVDHREAAALVRAAGALPHVEVEGVFSHLACADDLSPAARAVTDLQVERFDRVLAELERSGDRPALAHLANSAALLTRDDVAYDLVRPGIAVYGLPPDPALASPDLRPALTWRSQVAQVRTVEAGEGVGYGYAWRSTRRSRLATVPVGYADGFRRAPATWRHVLVRGRRAPVVGRISMDQTTVDVTDVPEVRTGDEVVLIGRQGSDELPAVTVAGWLGTSCYEVVSEILARVPRVT
jgi:Alr-MurF fusion protein